MLKHFLTFVIFLLIAVDSQAADAVGSGVANDDRLAAKKATAKPAKVEVVLKPAKIRGDGMLIDDNNLIIGIRNLKDKRADAYTYYYYGVSKDGEVTDTSVYRVYQNPDVTWADFVMEKLTPDDPIDDSKILATSANNRNVIFAQNGNIYFNGKKVKSGATVNGGIVVLVKDVLTFNGTRIASGTMVKKGKVVGQITTN